MAEKPNLISGVVRDSQGNPVAGARVYFTNSPTALPDIAALTGSGGEFSLSVPARGTYALECNADGFAPKAETVIVGGEQEVELDIKLKK
jgi:hypothetical protein